MNHYSVSSERAQSPADEDEEDGEEHEQIRLVETPDPVIVRRMDNSNKGIQTVDGSYNNFSVDGIHSSDQNDPRSVQCQNEFYSHYLSSRENRESSQSYHLRRIWKKFWNTKWTPVQWVFSLLPILSWLPNYNWKSDLAYDASAGFTVAVMHIPQGMAYALLANVEPIVGLYMAFFPVIVYSILGTSRHVSIGTFAVICLMSGKVATEKAGLYSGEYDDSLPVPEAVNLTNNYSTTEISAALSLCVGIWQLLMGVFQLGSLSVLLSAELISGFTSGCAIHVLTSQMKNLLGLRGARRTGIFKIPLSYMDIVLGLSTDVNTTAVILSVVTMTVLITYNELLKPLLNRQLPFPIPIELVVIVIGTLLSRYWITSSAYGISIVDTIPTGLPKPSFPPSSIIPSLLVDSLIIAIVAYAISISMAKIFAHRHEYEVRPNQELIANGSSNLIGSFFSCAPVSASLSRSLIQEQVGGRTQLAGIFTAGILLVVLLWFAPFFETLPHCILSSLILVALKGMFMQIFTDLPEAWRESRVNALIWIVSFLATVFLDIEYGLVCGLIVTISSLLWKSNKFKVTEMGQHFTSNLFVEKISENMVADLPGIKILKLTGNLNFVTADSFTASINNILDKCYIRLSSRSSNKLSKNDSFYSTSHSTKISINTLILDFSSVSSVDPAAVKSIREMYEAQQKQEIQVLFVACPSSVLEVMDHCSLFNHVNVNCFYPSIEHAVLYVSCIGSVNDNDNQHQTVVTSISDKNLQLNVNRV